MKTIVDDPEGFFEQGGWSFLDPESEVHSGSLHWSFLWFLLVKKITFYISGKRSGVRF